MRTPFILLSAFAIALVAAQDPATKVPQDVNGANTKPSTLSEFCKQAKQKHGLTTSDGSQIKTGACSDTPQGAIPSFDNMVSTLIVQPQYDATLDANVDNAVTIDILGLETGFFDVPTTQYYLFPQTLNNKGQIQGHQHVVVQDINQGIPSAQKFVFFKGLNAPSNDGRTLSVVIPKGTFKANGAHRICSITGTFSHQPVIMAVAQRGSQDDCIRGLFLESEYILRS
ncbi:hypothetical protein BJ742DRAFT_121053 [Cladochytrium replicatum]|nr:hypothetical protein BJ742DRAFT_121053 [Cladochytrium replicatum]